MAHDDVILLAEASVFHVTGPTLIEKRSVPVLSSPRLGLERAEKELTEAARLSDGRCPIPRN